MTRVLAFVHGFMGDPSDWDFIRTEFPEFEVVTPLIRPASDWSAGVEQLKAEIPDGAVLIGYSMGARLSLALTIAEPDRYRGLIFCSGNPGLETEQIRSARFKHDCEIANRIQREDRSAFLEYWYTESTVFRSLTERVREAEINRKLARSGDDWSAVLRCYSVANQPNYWPSLSLVTVPVMAIAGLDDRKYARITARMGTLSNIQARIVPACGHIVHHEQPHIFLQLVREFLSSF